MRRMITDNELNNFLSKPDENNKVFCTQFVADEVVLNNVEPNLYIVKLTQTDGDNISYNLIYFDFKYESTYGSIYSSFFYDFNNDRIIALKGEYSGNSKTLTLTLIDTTGTTIQSPTSFHLDIYKL